MVIDQAKWFMREGQLVINLFVGEVRMFSLAFSLGRDGGERTAFVGAVQGRDIEGVADEYRDLTKAAHGMRPRDLLFEIFRMLCSHPRCDPDPRGVRRLSPSSQRVFWRSRPAVFQELQRDVDRPRRRAGGADVLCHQGRGRAPRTERGSGQEAGDVPAPLRHDRGDRTKAAGELPGHDGAAPDGCRDRERAP